MGKRSKKTIWRKDSRTNDIEENIAKQSTKQLQDAIPDDAIFFTDKPSEPKKPKLLWCQKVVLPTQKADIAPRKRARNAPSEAEERKVKKIAVALQKQQQQTEITSEPALEDVWANKPDPTLALPEFIRDIPTIFPKPVRRTGKAARLPDVAAVEPAHPGASYNPSYSDHQNALGEAVAAELRAERKRTQLAKKLAVPDHIDVSTIVEGPMGLLPIDEQFEDVQHSDSDSDGEGVTSRITYNEKKTKQQRNKEKRHNALQIQQLREKRERKRQAQISNAPTLSKQIDHDDKVLNLKRQLRARVEEERSKRPARTGKHLYRETPTEVLLTSELPPSLRLLKTQGNIAKDRYKSLQKRNVITVSGITRRKQKTLPRVEYVKKSHKERVLRSQLEKKKPKST